MHEHEIYEFLGKQKTMKISEVCEALGQNREMKDDIREKLLLMARYGIIFKDGEYVSTSKIFEKRTEHDMNIQGKLKPITMDGVERARVLISK